MPLITLDNPPKKVLSEPKTSQSKLGRPKSTTDANGPNFKPDQSLILQGKKQRNRKERFETKAIETTSESQSGGGIPKQTVIEPMDSFSKFPLKENKQKRKAPHKNKRNPAADLDSCENTWCVQISLCNDFLSSCL